MDSLMNAGKAAGFSSAKGRTIRVKGVQSRELSEISNLLDKTLVELSATCDIVWVDIQTIVKNSAFYEVCAFVYYTER